MTLNLQDVFASAFTEPTDTKTRDKLPPFPMADDVAAFRIQFFDNARRSDYKPTKGKSRYTVHLEVQLVGQPIRMTNPPWWRTVQLLDDPANFRTWAEQKYLAGEYGITDEMLEYYRETCATVKELRKSGKEAWVGHIGDPRNGGKTYYPGQFVLVTRNGASLQAWVIAHDNAYTITNFIPPANLADLKAPLLVGQHDPDGLFKTKKQDTEAKRASE